MTIPNRRPCVTYDVGGFTVSVGFDPLTGHPCEFFFVSRGKTGQQLWQTLEDVGVMGSKIMQHEFE